MAAPANDGFGAFQTTTTPAPIATVVDDDFGAFVASKASQPDPFAAPVPQPVTAAFDAFGNNTVLPQSNPMGGNINNMTNAFGNISMGQSQPLQVPSTGDDEFGDFADAAPKPSIVSNSNPSDPMAKLVSLDGLSKNPRNNVRKCHFGGSYND